MANSKQATKRARQAHKSRLHNASQRSMLRTYIKNTLKAIETGDAKKAAKAFELAVPVIDAAANKGLIHQNKAARHKSRLNNAVKTLSAA